MQVPYYPSSACPLLILVVSPGRRAKQSLKARLGAAGWPRHTKHTQPERLHPTQHTQRFKAGAGMVQEELAWLCNRARIFFGDFYLNMLFSPASANTRNQLVKSRRQLLQGLFKSTPNPFALISFSKTTWIRAGTKEEAVLKQPATGQLLLEPRSLDLQGHPPWFHYT